MIVRERPEKSALGIDVVIEGLGTVVDLGDTNDKLNEAIVRQTIGIDSSIREMRMRIAGGICNRQERGDSATASDVARES